MRLAASLSYRVATRRHCLILLKKRSIKLRARYRYGLKQIGSLRFRFGGMFAHAPCRQPDPVRVVSTIREQHRLWEQSAEENRTQPIVVSLTGPCQRTIGHTRLAT